MRRPAPPEGRRGRPARLIAAAALLGGGLVALGTPLGPLPPLGPLLDPASGVWAVARSAILPASATARLPGLDGPVSVVYDRRGVPHIFAETEADAYRAQGYVVARDRLFQLELQTRATTGRLTEWVGPLALPADRLMRSLGLAGVAERQFAQLDTTAPDHLALRAYAEGVNAWITGLEPRHLPLEYRLLDIRPEPWRPEHTLYLLQRMNWTLSYGQLTPKRERVAALVGPRAADALLAPWSPIQEPIIPNGREAPRFDFTPLPEPELGPGRLALDPVPTPPSTEGPLGSNNWALAGARTGSGFPILAGDPHLELTLPSIWYEIHLVVPGVLDVYGATIPGAPGVIIGFNRHLAWSFTNTEADVMDYYREAVDDAAAPTRTRLDGGWRDVERRLETYRDRDGAVVARDTFFTSHRGPLLREGDAWLSLRWTALEPSRTQRALLAAPKAENARDWLTAMEAFAVPPQNALVADRFGTIAIRSTGHFPLRPASRGGRVLDGSTSANDWTGYRPPARMPQAIDPDQGYLASANQQPSDPLADSTYLGADWRQPWRAIQINRLLRARHDWTPEEVARLQTDPRSAKADFFVPYFRDAVARLSEQGRADSIVVEAGRMLGTWDLRYTLESAQAVLFEFAMEELTTRIWDELGDDESTRAHTPPSALLPRLLEDPTNAWWDVRATDVAETRDSILLSSLRAGFERAREEHGPPGTVSWHWGNVRQMQIHHLLRIPALSALDVPNAGGTGTLSPMGAHGTHGASWRMVVELGPKEVRARTIYPGGQSGNPASPWYQDRLARWSAGELDAVSFPVSPEELLANQVSARLSLTP